MTIHEGRAAGLGAPQAECALHPPAPATGVCARCGNFVCDECTDLGVFEMCPTCRERLGIGTFPLRRDAWTVGALFSYCWEAYQRHWGMLLVATLMALGMSFVDSFAFQLLTPLIEQGGVEVAVGILVAGPLVQTVVNILAELFMVMVTIDVLLGRGVRFDRFGRLVRKLAKALVQCIVVAGGLYLPLFALLTLPFFFADDLETMLEIAGLELPLLVPVIYVSLGLMFMQYEIVYDDAVGPLQAIARSWRLAHGHRLRMLGVTILAGLIMAAGLLVCCVGVLASYPFGFLLLTGLYLALRQGSDLPPPVRDANVG